MHTAGFETAILAVKRLWAYALDRTVTGSVKYIYLYNICIMYILYIERDRVRSRQAVVKTTFRKCSSINTHLLNIRHGWFYSQMTGYYIVILQTYRSPRTKQVIAWGSIIQIYLHLKRKLSHPVIDVNLLCVMKSIEMFITVNTFSKNLLLL
jgi:hypothetical protein